MGDCAYRAVIWTWAALLLSVPAYAEPDAPAASKGLEEVRIESAPRAAQIEPIIVAPVKRVMPKTPDIGETKQDVNTKSAGGDTKKAKSLKVVGDKPNCDHGYKPDADGKSCVRIAESAQTKKKKR